MNAFPRFTFVICTVASVSLLPAASPAATPQPQTPSGSTAAGIAVVGNDASIARDRANPSRAVSVAATPYSQEPSSRAGAEDAATGEGSIAGAVADPSRAVIVGATVRLEPLGAGARASTITDRRGTFLFDRVPPGEYVVIVERPGFAAYSERIEVKAGAELRLGVALDPAGVAEEVVVTATRVPMPVSSVPNTVSILDQEAISRRSAVSDDLPSLLEASVPGFGPSLKKLTGRGETFRGRNPLYMVNGVPQHTPLRDGERDGHSIDLAFVERIEVIHGANAIQGIGATGGIVNLVTKSPRQDGSWTHDVKLSLGNHDGLDDRGWSSKLSYLLGKRVGRLDVIGGGAIHKRGLFFDARGDAIGLYPTQGDIMDSTARDLYVKAGLDLSSAQRLEVAVNDFRLARDGDFAAVAGDRASGRLSTTVEGDPREEVGDPAVNDVTTISFDYRHRRAPGGELTLQAFVHDYEALFEGGTFPTFALAVGGPAFLDQSAIRSDKIGAKLTWSLSRVTLAGISPMVGFDVSRDRTAQVLARTGREWVPETELLAAAPFFQLQRLVFSRLLLSGGLRIESATVRVDDYTTLPSSRSTFVSGGSPSFVETLPNAGAVIHVTDRVSVYGSFSQGFTMPDAGRVLRGVNVPGQDVDHLVDIAPVVADNLEAGIDYRLGATRLHAAYYRSVSARGSLLERTADNVYRVARQPTSIDGMDLQAETAFGDGWVIGGNLAWLRGRFDSNGDGVRDTDLDGLNIAPTRVNLFAEGRAARQVTGRVQVSTLLPRSFSGLATRDGHDFGGYTTADLSLAFETRAGVLRAGVENLLDRQYITYFSQVDPLGTNDTFFAGPGRSFTLVLESRF